MHVFIMQAEYKHFKVLQITVETFKVFSPSPEFEYNINTRFKHVYFIDIEYTATVLQVQ